MNVSIHTHGENRPSLRVDANTETEWNPWLRFIIKPHHETGFNLPDDLTLHLSGLSIEEGYAFIDSYDEAGHKLREWVNYRSSEQNEDVTS